MSGAEDRLGVGILTPMTHGTSSTAASSENGSTEGATGLLALVEKIVREEASIGELEVVPSHLWMNTSLVTSWEPTVTRRMLLSTVKKCSVALPAKYWSPK